MEFKMLLSKLGFPEKFENSSITVPIGMIKKDYIEKEILDSILKCNFKLHISKIEYLDKIKDQFEQLETGTYAGVIVEDTKIDPIDEYLCKENGSFVWNQENSKFARKIVAYVFLSDYKVNSRNSAIAQVIFPEIIDYMKLYIESPSYAIANHPIYFINIFSEEITADSIIKQIAGMIILGIKYIEVFKENMELKDIPRNITDYINRFYLGNMGVDKKYSCEYFEVDFEKKMMTIKTDKLVPGEYLVVKTKNPLKYDFNGSSEKFYWLEIMPIIFLARENNFIIDYSLLEKFYSDNENRFSKKNEKLQRFYVLIEFIKKIMLRRD